MSLQGAAPLLSQLLRGERAAAPRISAGCGSLLAGMVLERCPCVLGRGDSAWVLVLALDTLLACAESGVTLSGLAKPGSNQC